jgi:type VI secretion system secreted protein Hcp
MAHPAYISIKGTKQGQFKGGVVSQKGKSKGEFIPLVAFDFGVESPFDAGSGSATGKRQHNPVTVVVEAGPLSQQLLQAFRTGEVLTDVSLQTQPEQAVPTVHLTNSMIVKCEHATDLPHGVHCSGKRLYSVDLTYQRIRTLRP